MHGLLSINYLKRKEIDATKWDDCIADATNGLIYGYSFYLDHLATNWDALVLNDYEAVMPLPWRRKWGIAYLYQPFLTAQLGLFGKKVTVPMLENFLRAIPKTFLCWDFPLNYQNLFGLSDFKLYQRSNYVLLLNKPYEDLYKGYNENLRRNLKKSKANNCIAKPDVPLEDIVVLTGFQPKKLQEKDIASFKNLFSLLQEKRMVKTYGVFSHNGKLLSSAVFLFSHNRAYYILVGNHPDGRSLGASHALIHAFIKDHAARDLSLDFEGSDMQGLASFYRSFGAAEEKYAAIRQIFANLF